MPLQGNQRRIINEACGKFQAFVGRYPVASGLLLRPGMEGTPVPELARRLVSEGYLAKAPGGNGKQYPVTPPGFPRPGSHRPQ